MTSSPRYHISLVAAAVFLILTGAVAAQDEPTDDPQPETTMTEHIRGTFDVKMIPQQPSEGAPEAIGRMLLDKQYHGELEGTGQGQFLGFRSAVEGSAGYVAMELVEGTLAGHKGTFVLQHSGSMNRGELGLALGVVPDSGTGELEGLSGTMNIVIEEGQHFYEFEYSLGK